MTEPTEQSPLVQRQEEPASSSCAACIKESLSKWSLFYVLCFLSGQYINFEILNNRSPLQSSCKKIFSVIALIPFIGQIVVCIGYVGTAIAVEGVTIANVSYNDSSTGNGSNICTLPQEHWKFTTAITISTIAAFSSYSLMTFFVLIPVNGCCCCNDDCTEQHCCQSIQGPMEDEPQSKQFKHRLYLFDKILIYLQKPMITSSVYVFIVLNFNQLFQFFVIFYFSCSSRFPLFLKVDLIHVYSKFLK